MAISKASEHIFNAITRLHAIISVQSSDSFEEKVATKLQFSALSFIKEHDLSTMGELGSFLHLSKSSSTQLIERLVKAGLVAREADANDRRLMRLSLTKTGQTELVRMREVYLEKIDLLLSKLSVTDRDHIIRIYTSLSDQLQNEQRNS